MKLNFKRSTVLFGPVNLESSGKILAELIGIEGKGSPGEESFLFINSGGGGVDAGNTLIDLLPHAVSNLVTVGTGMVGSMAIPVFLCGSKRVVTKHARFFFHEIGRTYKDIRLGVGEVESDLRDLRIVQGWYVDYVISRTNGKMKPSYLRKIMREETFLFPDDLIRYGLVDEVLVL